VKNTCTLKMHDILLTYLVTNLVTYLLNAHVPGYLSKQSFGF